MRKFAEGGIKKIHGGLYRMNHPLIRVLPAEFPTCPQDAPMPPPSASPRDLDDEPQDEGGGRDSAAEIRSELFSNGFPTFGLKQHAAINPTDFIGQEVAGYRIVRLLGEGGMSWVFEADQSLIDKPVAFKICKPGTDRRLEAEANILKDIRHPGIAQVLAGGRLETPIGPLTYIVTEMVPHARHLDDHCSHFLPNLRCRVELFTTICDAVAYAHTDQNLIHRDLKPGNILVDADGRPKVIDFGIARTTSAASDETTKHTVVGTPDYMSPEQRCGTRLSPASDVYSLGLILKVLVSDESVLASSPGTRAARNECARDRHPPRGLERIIARCLNGDPTGRYADAGHLARAVRRWLRWHLPDWLDRRRAIWPDATRRWLASHRRTILRGGMAAACGAAAIWAIFVRPDTSSYADAVAVAARATGPEPSADSMRTISEANRVWRLARPFASSPPLELVCLKGRHSGAAQGSLIAAPAHAMAFRSHPAPLAAVGSAGGVALIDVNGPAGGLLRRLGNPAPISAVAFSADGTRLIAGDEAGRTLIWDTSRLTGDRIDTTPRRIATATSDSNAMLALAVPAAAGQQAHWCLALDAGGGITRIDLPSDGKEPRSTLLATVMGARDIALLESGRLLAIASSSGTVEFRDLGRPDAILRREELAGGPIDLAHDPLGRVLYAVTPRRLLVWKNPRASLPLETSLPSDWEGSFPRVVLGTADACLIARQAGDQASLHCFRDVRSRLDPVPRWRETLALTSPAKVRKAILVPGEVTSFTMLDDRGYLTTSR
jgi:hypothetical protein